MTTQQKLQYLFDRVSAHLIKQNTRSQRVEPANGSLKCAYRGDDGTSCAVGCLISDEHYTRALEGRGAESIAVIAAVEQSLGFVCGRDATKLLTELQYVHDCRPVPMWQSYLARIAEDFNLTLALAV